MSTFPYRRAMSTAALGLCLMFAAGCSGDAKPTEEGRQADLKDMQDTAAANDAAAGAAKKAAKKGNVGVMPP